MDTLVYNKINNLFDISKLTEHQVSVTSINFSNLTSIANVTGMGILESVMMICGPSMSGNGFTMANNTATTITAPQELVVTIDNTVVLDIVAPATSPQSIFGIIPANNLKYAAYSSSCYTVITGFENLIGGILSEWVQQALF